VSATERLDLRELKAKIEKFANDRDWKQFHNPKNISMALTVEAAELLEIFQWLTFEESSQASSDEKLIGKISDELADITVYCVRMCDILGIDLPAAIDSKMKKNAEKYPVEVAKGSAKKYTDY